MHKPGNSSWYISIRWYNYKIAARCYVSKECWKTQEIIRNIGTNKVWYMVPAVQLPPCQEPTCNVRIGQLFNSQTFDNMSKRTRASYADDLLASPTKVAKLEEEDVEDYNDEESDEDNEDILDEEEEEERSEQEVNDELDALEKEKDLTVEQLREKYYGKNAVRAAPQDDSEEEEEEASEEDEEDDE